MPRTNIVSILLVVTGLGLLASAGYSILADRHAGESPIEIGFTNPASLDEIKSLSPNRLQLAIHNQASYPVRIVGNDAC